jgi:acyl-CoA thioester hydrolase
MIELNNIHQIRVRYSETDKMGVGYNANYLLYFEVGRNELMRRYSLTLADFEENEKVFLPVIDTYVKFKISAHYDELLTIETKFIYEDAIIVKFEYKIKRDETLLCEGYTRHCFTSQENMKPIKLPKRFLNILNSLKNN